MAGDVVHVEIPAEDMERAQQFWSGVFGWEFGPSMSEEFDYRMARISEGAGAALMPAEERGHPNYYFDVPDIDAAIGKVRELGGQAADKQPVPTHGWFAAATDTEGNAFHLWQGDSTAGS
ncbi:MAG TPA: VOC family protein [Gaiellaceae bacterium]|nr:VOC family protein [Gaiellaceae bacterium]